MALVGPLESLSGVVCQYHRVIQIDNMDFVGGDVRFKVGHYSTEELRNAGKKPLQVKVYRMDLPEALPTNADIRSLLYSYLLGLPENGNLVSDE